MPAAPPSWAARPVASQLHEPGAGVEHGDEPAGCLEPERRRHGLLQQRATGHRRVAVRPASVAHASATRCELVEHEAERPRVTSIAAVSITSWLVAPRCTQRAGLLPHPRDERAHERLDRVADPPALQQQLLPVVAVGRARRGDRRRLGRGDDTGEGARAARARPRRRASPASHARPDTASSQLGRDEEGRERAHTAKNVVCPGPAAGCRSGGRRPRRRRRASRGRPRRGARAPGRRRSPPPRRGSRCG